MDGGMWYRLLRINLTDRTVTTEDIDRELVRKHIGGAGLAAIYLQREVPAKIKPLDPDNRLIFTTGPFQATKFPGGAKFSVVSRSPLTGIFADSAAGADWGLSFKKCGYDMLIVQGKSEKPVYLLLEDEEVKIVEAVSLWGKDAYKTGNYLKEKHPGVATATIGMAGENGVTLANIVVDNFSFAGRCGLGAVMGSKNLKGVAVKGSLSLPVYDGEKLAKLEREYRKSIAENAGFLRTGGTVSGLVPGEKAGNIPVKNFSEVGWKEGAEKLGIPGGYSDILQPSPHACKFCPVACHRSVDVEFEDGYTYSGPGPEYETLAMLGSNCMIDDLEMMVKINDYCNRAGIDTISAGSCAAFAMEALEKDHCGEYQPDYDFTWGNANGVLKFLEELVEKKGFGGLFAEGLKKVLANFSPEAEEYACHVKGLDIPAQDPRVYYNLALNYITGNRGACHMRSYSQIATMGALLPEAGIDTQPEPDTLEGAAHVVKVYQDFTSFYNSCVLCQFMIWGGLGLKDMVEVLNTITGWNMEIDQVLESGERVFNLQRLINIEYGIEKNDDTLPPRILEPSEAGPRAGKTPAGNFEKYRQELYKERGWNKEGIPEQKIINSLGVSR